MCKTRNKKRLVSILTTFALTTQMFPLSSSTSYARVIEDDPNETFSQEINNTSIITNGLQGTYYSDAQFTEHLLIRMEDSDAMYDLDALKIPKVFKGKMENVHSIKWDGTIEPQYSEVYTFTTSDNEHIKLWVNDQILINGLNFDPLPIQMEEGELYHIRVAYSNPDEPLTDLDIKWSSESQEEEVISKEHIFLPVHSEDAGNSFSPEDLLVDELEEVIEEMSEELLEIQEEVIESTEEQVEETETPEPTEEQIEETETSEPLEEQVEETETPEPTEEQIEETETSEPLEEQVEETETPEPTEEQIEETETSEPLEEQVEETETSEPLEEQVEEVETAETIKEQVEEAEITEPTEEQTEEAEITELIDEQVEAGGTESTDEQIETETLAKKVSEVGLFGSTAALDNLVGQNDEPSSVDTDNDGIIDYWEMEGYTHIAGLGLVSWEDEYAEFDAQRYVTSPYRKSTDEDPYSDLEEVMGQVDQAIDPLATHPLVPAFPDIQAEIESITITPNEMITTTDGTVLTEAWSDSTDKSKTTASSLGFKSGFEVGFEKSFGIKEGGASAKINGKVYGEANGQWDKSKTKTTTRVDSKQDTTSWSQATTTNPSEAATSVWNVKYTNKGTAPAYEIVPSLSLQIGDKTAVSMVPASTNIIQSIAPDNYYPSNGTIALQYIESGTVDTLPIKLTLDQVQLIQMGYPISLTTNQINAKALQLDNNGDPYLDDWNKYKVAIDAVSASITYVHPDKGEKNFKVYANDPRRSYASSNPETTLGDALKLVLDAEVVDGKFLIDGEEVNNDWRIFMLSENDDDYDILQQADDLFEIELRPDMDIIIEKTDLNGSPFVQYAFYEEGGKRVVASIFENGSSIDYVKAKVRTITGEAKTIDLIDEDEKGEIDGIYESPNQVELLDLTYQNAEIEVRAVNGEITTTYILTPEGESVRGLGYVPLNNVKDVTDRIDTLSQDYPTAEAFVFEVKDTKTTSNMHRAKVGNQKVYLGVNNQPTEYRGAATRYSLFRDKNYDSDQINLTSSVSDLRSGAIDSLSNKASSVKFKQDDSGSGIVLYNKYDYRGKDDVLALTGSDKDITDTDMNDRASSVRIIGQSGKPFVRLYNNKVANKNTNSYGSDYVDVHGYKDISGYFNNKASSFEVIGGEDMNYFTNIQLWDVLGKDDNKLYKQNKDNYIPLQDLDSLNNKVSHVQLICTEDDCPTFKLYKGKDYKNELLYHSISPGFTSMSNNEINEYIDKFDEVSSIKVKNNSDRLSKIIIYKDNGNYAVIDSSISDLSSFKDVIYKGKSSGTRDFNNKIVAIKFYYGVVYRFYTGKNYSGSYQDYIIGEDNIGSDWSNKFSSVRVLNPLPEIGLIAYDETNYGGDFLPVVDDIPDLSAVDFNNKISSVKLITRIPEKRPTHNTTMVVSSKDLSFKTSNKYFGEGTSVNLIGYFERTDQSSKFTPYEHNVKYATTGSYSFDTGINDARGYLVQVDANRVTSNKVRIKLNDTSNSELGTSATHALGLEAGAKFNPKHSNVVFVPAKNNDPSRISVDIEVGAWDDKEDQDGNVPSYNVKVIGYFAEDAASSNDLFYEKFDTPVAVASPSVTDERTSRVTLQTRDFRDEPKGYLVNVTGKHIGGSNFKFSINENYIHLGTAASVNAKGEDPRSVHHSGLMYVKANSIDAYLLEMTPNYGSWIAVDSDAEIDVEVVGYFY